jgi:hypothetical protein
MACVPADHGSLYVCVCGVCDVAAGYYTVPPSEGGVLLYRFRYCVGRTSPLSIVAEGIPRAIFCSSRNAK